MIVIGADTHKRNHTLVAVDAGTGALRGQLQIAASDAGSLDALRFGADLDEQRVWAIEDCRHVPARLERELLAAGERVIRMPGRDDRPRPEGLTPGREVRSDRRACGRAGRGPRRGRQLPAAVLDEATMEIRVLNDYRDQIIWERTG